MVRRLMTLATVTTALIALVGCGSDGDSNSSGSDEGGSSTDTIVAMLVEQGAPQAEAECIAEELDGVSVDELTEFFDAIANDEEIPAGEGVAKKFINARGFCLSSE